VDTQDSDDFDVSVLEEQAIKHQQNKQKIQNFRKEEPVVVEPPPATAGFITSLQYQVFHFLLKKKETIGLQKQYQTKNSKLWKFKFK
jgi:hypothetical protein